MANLTRRDFVTKGMAVAAAGGGLLLLGEAAPTEASGALGSYADFLNQGTKAQGGGNNPPAGQLVPTADNILGPYHRAGAPFRAKVTPVLEPGTPLLISGRVWGQDTRKPMPNTVIDIWQANAQGRYDNDDPKRPPAANVFLNRARLVTDENGYYEYETIHPGPYRIDQKTWRPAHIHYWVRAAGYRELITQLYFRGDPHNRTDAWIRESLIIDLQQQKTPRGELYRTGTFNIVLARMPNQ
jgi:catechol 1,2-dioxygenase